MTKINSKSGNMTHADYDTDSGIMTARFKGGREYAYEGVPRNLWEQFRGTFPVEEESTGQFFHQHIKGRFPDRMIKGGGDSYDTEAALSS